MNEQSVKCRICWDDKETKNCLVLSAKWGIESTKSIKEILLLCVPCMSVEDTNLICRPCLWQLKFTYKFVERCVKTENILNEANNKGKLSLEDIFEKSLENGNNIHIIFENSESSTSQPDQDSNVELWESLQENDENVPTVDIQEEVKVESVPASDENEAAVNLQISITENNVASEHNYYMKKGIYITSETISSQENVVGPNVFKKSGDLEESDALTENRDVPTDNDLEDSNYTLNEFEKENTCIEVNGSSDSERVMISDPPTETVILKQILDSRKSNKLTKKNLTKVTHVLDPPIRNKLTDLLDIAPIDVWFITSQSEVTKEQQDGLFNDGVNMLNMSKDPTKSKRTIFLSRDLKLKSYHCLRCRDKFKSRSDYLDHMHFHRKGKTPGSTVHTCPVCSETFGFEVDFRNHSRKFHCISKPHHCSKCNKRFKTLNLLKDHENNFKDQEKCTYKCKQCRKEFSKLSSLQQHENDIKDAPCCNYHKCRVCFKKFTKEEFKVHCSEIHRNYLCQDCGKSFHEARTLSAHRRVHNHIDSMCHECGKILSSPHALKFHMESVHGTKKYTCDICPRAFSSAVYLRQHSKRHTDKSKKERFKCEKCGKEFVSKDTLFSHERMVHLQMKRFTCHICNEGFARNDYFQRHLKTHVRNSKYSCPVCRKCFAADWRLEYHISAGHDENGKPLEKPDEPKKAPYVKGQYSYRCVCKICNKVIANTAILNLHYRDLWGYCPLLVISARYRQQKEKMNEQNVKCRICWDDKETKNCLVLSAKWGIESTKSIKEIMLLCVPWMSVEDTNLICRPCLWQLKFTYKFVERCLKTENILNEANNKSKLSLEDIFEKSLENGNNIQIIFENPESSTSQPDQDSNGELQESSQQSGENEPTINIQEEVIVESVPASDENEAAVNLQINNTENNVASEHNYYMKKGFYITSKTISSQENVVGPNVFKKSGDLEESDALTENRDVPTENDLEDSNYTLNEFEKENTCNEVNGSGDSESVMISDPPTETVILKQTLDSGKTNKSTRKSTKKNVTKVTHVLDPPIRNELTDLLDIAPIDIWFITSQSEVTKEQQDGLINDGVNMLNLSKDPTKSKRTIFLSRDLKLRSVRCARCRAKFKSRSDYLDHLHFHRKGKTPGSTVHTCPVCSETFGFDVDFRKHSRMFHGISKPHHCSKCNKRFRTLNLLKYHEKQFKDQEKCMYKCKQCGKEFNKLSSLQKHENDIKDAPCCNYHKCRVCFKKFTKEEFKVHCTEIHPNYLCQECGKSFHEAHSLSAHRRVHNHIDSMCHECGKILSSPSALRFHMQSVHGTKKYTCDICSRPFSSAEYLRQHSKIHTDKSKKVRFKCEKCGKEYVYKDSLTCHERMVHLQMKRFTCHICNEGFARNDYFQRHLKTHVRNSKYSCPICRKCFAVDWRLEHHMRAGHDENGKPLEKPDDIKKAPKKYTYQKDRYNYRCVCKLCSKVVANTQILNMHYRAHLKLRKYKCNFCETTFQTKMSLSRHAKLHTDPNFEFSCNICHAYKSSSADLESHMLEVHKNKKYKCQLCSEAFGRKHLLADHESTVHQENNYKKELILNILEKDPIFVNPKDDRRFGVKGGNKGKKIGSLEVDINKVYDDLVNKKNSLGSSTVTSQDINSEELQTNIQRNNGPVQIAGKKNVIVLNNIHRSIEAEQACESLEEESS